MRRVVRAFVVAAASAMSCGITAPALAADTLDSPTKRPDDWVEQREAQAQAVAPPPQIVAAAPAPRVALALHGGFGTPYGGAGLAVDVSLIKELALEAGVGTNFYGVEPALMSRLRFGVARETLATIGFGASTVKFVSSYRNGIAGVLSLLDAASHRTYPTKRWERAWFLNFEIGIESYSETGHTMTRFYLGYASLLNPAGGECHRPDDEWDEPCDTISESGVPYAGFAVGFELFPRAARRRLKN